MCCEWFAAWTCGDWCTGMSRPSGWEARMGNDDADWPTMTSRAAGRLGGEDRKRRRRLADDDVTSGRPANGDGATAGHTASIAKRRTMASLDDGDVSFVNPSADWPTLRNGPLIGRTVRPFRDGPRKRNEKKRTNNRRQFPFQCRSFDPVLFSISIFGRFHTKRPFDGSSGFQRHRVS